MSREYVQIDPEQYAVMAAADTTGALEPWRVIVQQLHAAFRLPSFTAAATLAASIAAVADERDHHPTIDVRHPGIVRIATTTHATGGLTLDDVELARAVTALAIAAGAESRPSRVQAVEFAIDTLDEGRIRPFWKAVLGYTDQGASLVDPLGGGPSVWFQDTDEARPQRNRIHIDVIVPHDQAQARVDAALAAGGTMVTDRFARSWWVLADAEGNEACVCTWQDRNG